MVGIYYPPHFGISIVHLTHSSKKNKSLIEVFSLALNFTVLFFAILVFLSNALIDVNHQSEMQRINTSFFLPNGDIINSAQVPLPLEYVLSKEGGDNIIADYTKKHTVIYDGKQLNDVLLHQVSSNFFTNFNISTSPLAELSQNEVHISKKFNDLYLNISNSAGKKIHIKNVGVFNIASIFEHEPSSSLKPDIISSLNLKTLANYKSEQDNWYDTHINLFVKSDGKFKVTENKLKKLIKLYAPNLPGAPFTAQEFIKFNLTSLKNIHYDSGFSDEIVNTTPEYINFIVAAITLFTLISVTISYISSNTVLFLNNKPSISIKIAIGASFKQLLTEVVKNERFKLFQIMLIKSFLVMLIIPFFFDEFLMARVLTTVNVISVFLITTIMLLLFVFTIKFVSLHTIYKSISNPVISRFQSARSISIYKIFNSFQIFLASLIIFFGISIGAEMNTLYKAEFGFSTQNLYIMDLDGDIELSSSLKFDLKNSSDSIVSYSDWRPFIDSKNIITIEHSKQLQEEQLVSFNVINSDENFIAAMGLSTVIGESSKVTSSLSHEVKNVVVTEEFLNKFSRINKDNILNQKFYVENDGRKIELNIQKVVDNFHLSMPQKKIPTYCNIYRKFKI